MKKSAIFEEIVRIMKEDSSTKKDLQGANPESYRSKIHEEMSEEDFLYLMQDYLASFGVMSHVSIWSKNHSANGFRVRYYQESLYVLSANQDTGLELADKIVAIDNQPLDRFYEEHKDHFVSSTPERQFMEWAYFVTKAGSVTLERQGETMTVAVRKTKQNFLEKPFDYQILSDETVYLKLENFSDENQIGRLYKDSAAAISQSKNVIIDVRFNTGGSDSLYFPLLQYALPQGKEYQELSYEDFGMEILYTNYNVSLRLKQLETYLNQPDVSEESKAMIEEFSKELLANKGKGYVLYGDEETTILPGIKGQACPEKIFILSDVYCGSSGDNFVAMMKQLPKVTVLGRPTMGILDYSNCCQVEFGDYTFMFPTSRSCAIDHGKGMTDKGVEPDRWIPWTPEHLKRDIDLEECLKRCRQ